MEDDLKKMEDEPINLIGCDTIVNSPSLDFFLIVMNDNWRKDM